MATLTNSDFHSIKKITKRKPTFWMEFKSWGITKDEWQSALQAIEDWSIGGFNTTPSESLRSAIQGVTGAATVAQATALWVPWSEWKGRSLI